MTERAFVANTREARGLHEGSVTCLVRPVTNLIKQDESPSNIRLHDGEWQQYGAGGVWIRLPAPFGVVGDRLWVQDEWALIGTPHGPRVIHSGERVGALLSVIFNDEETGEGVDWQPAETMRRESCHTILDVTDVRVVRLNQVTEEDAVAAGLIKTSHYGAPAFGLPGWVMDDYLNVASCVFRWLVTDDVKANPWLWLATVTKVEKVEKDKE